MKIPDPEYANGTKVIYQIPNEAGSPMYRGRIVKLHWHSNHENEPNITATWTYTVVTGGKPDRSVRPQDILREGDI